MVTVSADPAGVDIRDATTADRTDIRRLLDQLHPGAAGGATLPRVRQESRTSVATHEDRTVGVAVVTLVEYGIEAYGMIEELVVDADHRGAGVGTALLQQCLSWFDATGADVVFVSAGTEEVTEFYASTDFVRCTGPWLFRTPNKEETP